MIQDSILSRAVVAIIVAAGRGSRMTSSHDVPKQYTQLGSMSILRRTVLSFLNHDEIDDVLVVIHKDDLELYREMIGDLDILPPVIGGERRQDSVRLGLESLKDREVKKVLIHDVCRPFVTKKIISSIVRQLDISPAAIPAIPANDTIKKCQGGSVLWTVDRSDLWLAQTPQGFLYQNITKQHAANQDKTFTDDASLSEYAGMDVAIIPGSHNNFKITTDEDYERALGHLAKNGEESVMETRTGLGVDFHKFDTQNLGPENTIKLGGIEVMHPFKLIGHSDADLVLHCITDAILGSIGAKDIGWHFSDQDPQWKNQDSSFFLEKVAQLARAKNAKINNLDINIICEKPRISEYREIMTNRIAEILNIKPNRVNIKGKTTEKMGFLGRGDGMAAEAIVTISIPCTAEE